MKNIDNTKLYHALKNAKIQGTFTAYTPFEGNLTDVETFSSLSYDAIVSYKWYMDEKNYVSVDSWYKDHIDVLLKINDHYLLLEYRDSTLVLQPGFTCPKDRIVAFYEIKDALESAFESARCEDDKV